MSLEPGNSLIYISLFTYMSLMLHCYYYVKVMDESLGLVCIYFLNKV